MKRIVVKSSYLGPLKSYNLFRISISFNPPALQFHATWVFQQKLFCIFSSSFIICFKGSCYQRLENNIVLKRTIFHSSVKGLIFHIFYTRWISVTISEFFFPLLIFHCNRNTYLTFSMSHYLDLLRSIQGIPPTVTWTPFRILIQNNSNAVSSAVI